MATTPEAVEVHWWWSHKYFIHPSGIQSGLFDERKRNQTQIERNSREFCFHSQSVTILNCHRQFFSRIRFQSVFIYTLIIAERMPFIKTSALTKSLHNRLLNARAMSKGYALEMNLKKKRKNHLIFHFILINLWLLHCFSMSAFRKFPQ